MKGTSENSWDMLFWPCEYKIRYHIYWALHTDSLNFEFITVRIISFSYHHYLNWSLGVETTGPKCINPNEPYIVMQTIELLLG